MNTHDIELPSSDEAAAHMLPSDLKKFESGEHVAEAFSIAVGNPDETSQPLFTLDQVRAAIEADRKRRGEPVAFLYEIASTLMSDGTYSNWSPRLSFSMPNAPDGSIRNLRCLYAAPQPAEPVKEIELRAEDLHISTYSPTHRPQWAAHNDRGVRIVHLPTGTVVESHEELSPHRNREIALDRLRQAIAAESVTVPGDDALADALSNLEHDNYEQSYSGYKNRQADIALIRAAIEADRKRRGEPVGSKKLYAVACLLSGRKGNQYITSGTLHTRFADSEEEAKGSAVSFALEEKPDLAIDQVLCMEVRAPQPAEPVNSQREAQNYADNAYNAGWNDAKAQPAEPVKVPSVPSRRGGAK